MKKRLRLSGFWDWFERGESDVEIAEQEKAAVKGEGKRLG